VVIPAQSKPYAPSATVSTARKTGLAKCILIRLEPHGRLGQARYCLAERVRAECGPIACFPRAKDSCGERARPVSAGYYCWGLSVCLRSKSKYSHTAPMIVRMMNTCGQHLSSCRFHSTNRPYEVNREMVTRSAIRTTVAPAILASFTPVLWSRQHNATGNKRARNLILPWPQIPSRRGTRWMSSPLRRSNLLAISKLQTTVPEF